MLVLPARTTGTADQFGTGALVGDPLSVGWTWGALAAIAGVVFTGIVLLVAVGLSRLERWGRRPRRGDGDDGTPDEPVSADAPAPAA
jgi:hypothetical protein